MAGREKATEAAQQEQHKDSENFRDRQKVFMSFFKKPRTRAEVEHLTGIRICSVCRYVGMLANSSLIKVHHIGICPVTGHGNVEFLTTNPDLFPEEKQLSLYDFFWKGGRK